MARVALQTLIDRSTKNMGAVHAVVKETTLEVIKRAYKEGINVQISAGYRSNAEQQRLFNQGRTTPGNIVTNAKPGQSLHNYGLAVDYFLTNESGTTAIWTVNANWRRVATIAKSLGFEWGGDWTGFVDYPHLQMTGGLNLSQLQAGKKPNLVSKVGDAPSKPSTSKPKPTEQKWTTKNGKWTGQVLEKGDCGPAVKDLQTKLANNNPPFYPEKSAKNNGIDSYYGAKTEDAVSRFQSYYGLIVDGVAGKKTYGKLTPKKAASKPASKPKPSGGGKHGKLKIVGVSNAAIIMDSPDRNKSKNLGTVKSGATLPLNGSVRGKNSDTGYWEVEFNGKLGYITGKFGKQV